MDAGADEGRDGAMSTMSADETDFAEQAGECWCCGNRYPDAALLHLGSHPEVRVCLGCGDYLAQRARERRDELTPSLAGRGRDVLRRARGVVMDHGWHELQVVGPVLRRLGRHLP
jgi:hypothetical protein